MLNPLFLIGHRDVYEIFRKIYAVIDTKEDGKKVLWQSLYKYDHCSLQLLQLFYGKSRLHS